MDLCNHIQETIARGAPLDAEARRHVVDCGRCAPVAAAYSLLDGTLEALASDVPPGFADRVMALIADDEARAPLRWFERRWIQIAFAHAAAACALFNVARFVMGIFVSNVALGGTP
jgi:hypothetical protein